MDMHNRLEMLFKQNEAPLWKSNKCKTESFSFLTLPLFLTSSIFSYNFFFMIKQNRIAYFKSFCLKDFIKSLSYLPYLLAH